MDGFQSTNEKVTPLDNSIGCENTDTNEERCPLIGSVRLLEGFVCYFESLRILGRPLNKLIHDMCKSRLRHFSRTEIPENPEFAPCDVI